MRFRGASFRKGTTMPETGTTRQSLRPARLVVACGAAVTLVACAGADDGREASDSDVLTAGFRTAVHPETSSDQLAPLGQPTTGAVESDGFPGGGEPTQLTDVRAAGHESFDRVVLEFAGPAPEYRVAYVEPPVREQGSGRAVDVEGEAFLQITASPASGVSLGEDEIRETYDGPDRLDPPYADVITEVVSTGDYEATLTWVIGLEHRVPFGVVVLEDPTRLVVDVRHQSATGGDDAGDRIPPVGAGGTDDVDADGSGQPVVVTDVRLGAHDGFDRIVFEFAGGGEPGYRQAGIPFFRIEQAEPPFSEDPSDMPVDVFGDAFVHIVLQGATGYDFDGNPTYDGPRRLTPGFGTLAQVVEAGDFEATMNWILGLSRPTCWDVRELHNPDRLVIDFHHV